MLYRQYCESGIYKIDKVKTIHPNNIMIFSEYQNKIRQLQNTRTPYCYQIKMVVNGKTYVKVISHIGLYPFFVFSIHQCGGHTSIEGKLYVPPLQSTSFEENALNNTIPTNNTNNNNVQRNNIGEEGNHWVGENLRIREWVLDDLM